jgi:hypothetical protein
VGQIPDRLFVFFFPYLTRWYSINLEPERGLFEGEEYKSLAHRILIGIATKPRRRSCFFRAIPSQPLSPARPNTPVHGYGVRAKLAVSDAALEPDDGLRGLTRDTWFALPSSLSFGPMRLCTHVLLSSPGISPFINALGCSSLCLATPRMGLLPRAFLLILWGWADAQGEKLRNAIIGCARPGRRPSARRYLTSASFLFSFVSELGSRRAPDGGMQLDMRAFWVFLFNCVLELGEQTTKRGRSRAKRCYASYAWCD